MFFVGAERLISTTTTMPHVHRTPIPFVYRQDKFELIPKSVPMRWLFCLRVSSLAPTDAAASFDEWILIIEMQMFFLLKFL